LWAWFRNGDFKVTVRVVGERARKEDGRVPLGSAGTASRWPQQGSTGLTEALVAEQF
jgi:hypothetical protein